MTPVCPKKRNGVIRYENRVSTDTV